MTDFIANRSNKSFLGARMNASFIYGLMFLALGGAIGYMGFSKLYDLFHIVKTLLPLGPAEQTIDKITSSWPIVFMFFVSFVSAVSAFLFGIVWIFNGITDCVKSQNSFQAIGSLQNPEKIATRINGADKTQVRRRGLRTLGSRLFDIGLTYTPVSASLLKIAFVSSIKICMLWLLLWGISAGLQVVPAVLKNYSDVTIYFKVPSIQILHQLFFGALVFNFLLALFLVNRKGPADQTTSEDAVIQGNFSPSFYLAIFENAFCLLNPKGLESSGAFRLRNRHVTGLLGTLVENYPRLVRSKGIPLGFLSIPVSVFLTVWGFINLIGFSSRNLPPMSPNFLSTAFPSIIVEIFFYLGLIWLGLYIADWVRILFNVRRFESIIAVCSIQLVSNTELEHSMDRSTTSSKDTWNLEEGAPQELLSWAKAPSELSRFVVSVSWSKMISEALVSSSTRYFCKGEANADTDRLVRKVFSLTQDVKLAKLDTNEPAGSGQ